jgi:hypothetical protein
MLYKKMQKTSDLKCWYSPKKYGLIYAGRSYEMKKDILEYVGQEKEDPI